MDCNWTKECLGLAECSGVFAVFALRRSLACVELNSTYICVVGEARILVTGGTGLVGCGVKEALELEKDGPKNVSMLVTLVYRKHNNLPP